MNAEGATATRGKRQSLALVGIAYLIAVGR